MNSRLDCRQEGRPTRTKIIATVGPACESADLLQQMVLAGADVFRLNFAHGDHVEMAECVAKIRRIAKELDRPIGILADLAGPKIRLGNLHDGKLLIEQRGRYVFGRQVVPNDPTALTTTYDGLIDDLQVDDRIMLADGTVSVRVIEKFPDRAVCDVEQPGLVRSGQGVNLPGTDLRLPGITEKDRANLVWAVAQGVDFIGLSFVRRASDILDLRQLISDCQSDQSPLVVAKIEKPEAVAELDAILAETDVVMVARGDLGVEVNIEDVPVIQKRIIHTCNRQRVPVITATQMLDSMQHNRRPTRAEASDVANAVLDGSDAVMLSGETAIGEYPVDSVRMMSRIVQQSEPLVVPHMDIPLGITSRNAASQLTRAVVFGAMHAAEQISASLIVVLTRGGNTAIAVSELRSSIPILAITDSVRTAQCLTIAWGVQSVVLAVDRCSPEQLKEFVIDWGRQQGLLKTDSRFVLVGTTDWAHPGKNLMLVHKVD